MLSRPGLHSGARSKPAWKGQLVCSLHQAVLVQFVLHHELRQISHHLAAGGHLHEAAFCDFRAHSRHSIIDAAANASQIQVLARWCFSLQRDPVLGYLRIHCAKM